MNVWSKREIIKVLPYFLDAADKDDDDKDDNDDEDDDDGAGEGGL